VRFGPLGLSIGCTSVLTGARRVRRRVAVGKARPFETLKVFAAVAESCAGAAGALKFAQHRLSKEITNDAE
jgi:hypothetical protein